MAYLLSAVAGCLGLMFTIFTLSGLWEARHGHDPVMAPDDAGTVGFAFSYTPLFVMRLIFWSKASAFWKDAARMFVGGVFAASLLAWAVAALLLLTGPAGPRPGSVVSDLVMAMAGQVGAIIWLLRYRRI